MRAAAVVTSISHFAIILLFALGLFLRLLSHLAVIALTIHASSMCDGRNKQRKSNK